MNGKMLLGICAVLLLVTTAIRRKKYQISLFRWIPLTIGVALMGLLGTYIMFFIENGVWYGQSFFGAVLFFPILLFPLAVVCRMSLLDLLDYATPPGIALLAPFKMNCYMGGCCGGRVLFFNENGIPTHFPSQIVEMIVAVCITIILLYLENMPKYKHKIYPICLILYGVTRFLLNWFRWEQEVVFLGLTAGASWAIISMIIGGIWLLIDKSWSCKEKNKCQHN